MNKESGFSLIQLSIVIIITSIGLAAAVKLATVEHHKNQEIKLQQNFENINELLLSYYTGFDENNNPIQRLPCPARQDLAIDHPNFGREDCTGVAILPGPVSHPDSASPMGVMYGAIPTKELSMATKDAFDVFGRQLLYAVSVNLTKDSNYLRNDMAAIQRKDDSGTVTGQSLPYVIVSMGDNGSGAFGQGGNLTSACDSTKRESENCDNDGVFLDAFITERENSSEFSDDRLGYDGKFFARAGQLIVINFECPENEVLRGMSNGKPLCTAMTVSGGGVDGDLDIEWNTLQGGLCINGVGSCGSAGASR